MQYRQTAASLWAGSRVAVEQESPAVLGPRTPVSRRAPAPVSPANGLVGRAPELSTLRGLATGVAQGRGGLSWVQGEAGIGKSALLDAVLDEAASLGCAVFRGAADERMTTFPLRLMASCLDLSRSSTDAPGGEIVNVLRGASATPEAIDPVLSAAERILEFVDRRCAEGPVILAAEDLHWADEASLLVWNRLARAVNQIPLLVIGTARPVPHRPVVDRLRDLVEQKGDAVLDLEPLAPGSVMGLAQRIVHGPPGPRLRAALGSAGGNPLYVHELLDALARDGLIVITGSVADTRGDLATVPASLKAAIENRLRHLPEATLTALRTAAVMGTEFDAGEWATVTGHSAVQIAEMVGIAATEGVLSGGGDRLRFRHELIRRVLADQIPPTRRAVLQRGAARDLASAGHAMDAVARHLLAIPGTLDEWALDWLADRPEQALFALPEVSAELLGRAVRSVRDDGSRWEALASRLAQVLLWLGRDGQACEVAAEVAERTSDVVLAAQMRIQIIRSAGRTSRPGQALAFTLRRSADERLPLLWRARLAAWSALLLHTADQAAEGALMARDALLLADWSGDPLTVAYARNAASVCLAPAARPHHIEAVLAALALRGQDPESTDLRMMLLANHATVSADVGQRAEAEAALAEGLVLAERAGTYRVVAIHAAAADAGYRYGRWDETLVHLEVLDREFLDTHPFHPVYGFAAMIAARRGDLDTADERLQAAARATDGSAPAINPLTEAQALRAEAGGDPARAAAIMSGWLDALPGLRMHDRHDSVLPYLVYLALVAGDAGLAETAAALAEADAAGDESPSRTIGARFCRSLLRDDGDGLLAAAASYGRYDWLPQRAFALEEAAVRLAAGADPDRARAALTGAVRTYASLGATWDIRRADTRLREHGVRRSPHSVRSRARTGWEALTPAEQRVAGLVAQGLSNPDIAAELFLSRRTVQTHVSNILGKLGLRSRLDIVRAVTQRGQPGAVGE